MSNVFRLLEIQRTGPDKKFPFVRVLEAGKIYRQYEQRQAAEGSLGYLVA